MTAHTYAWDEGHGGAYFLEGGVLCHAPWLADRGRFDWESAAQIDSRDLASDDPGWDFARAIYNKLVSWDAPCLHCGAAGGFLDRRQHEPGCSIVDPAVRRSLEDDADSADLEELEAAEAILDRATRKETR